MESVPVASPLTLFDGKVCRRCGLWKPFGAFWRHRLHQDGYGTWCKNCCDPACVLPKPPRPKSILSREQRARIAAGVRAHLATPQGKAQRSAQMRGKPRPQATRQKISATLSGHPVSAETRAKLRAATIAQFAVPGARERHAEALRRAAWSPSPEQRARLAERLRGRPTSVHARERLRAANLGRPMSEETKATLSALATVQWASQEKRAAMSALKKQQYRENALLLERARDSIAYATSCRKVVFTSLERAVMRTLTRAGVSYIPQKRVGPFRVDLFIEPDVIVECDGEYWHSLPHVIAKDRLRDAWFRDNGYSAYRLPEAIIRSNVHAAVAALLAEVELARMES